MPVLAVSTSTAGGLQGRVGGGIKAATVGTTVYLLPREHKRIRRLALDLDIPSVHELLLTGLGSGPINDTLAL